MILETRTGTSADIAVTPRFRIELPARAVSIAVGRSVIRRVVTFVDEDAESSFLVAFTEILANAIDEHHRIGSNDAVGVEVSFGSDDVVKIIDRGEGFRHDEVEQGDGTEGGRGLALALAFVEGLTISSGPTGTTASLPLAGHGIVR